MGKLYELKSKKRKTKRWRYLLPKEALKQKMYRMTEREAQRWLKYNRLRYGRDIMFKIVPIRKLNNIT